MSTPLSTAIYTRLAGVAETPALTGDALVAQAALAALLATDSDTSKPAVFFGNKAQAVVFPCITFRPNGGSIDGRIRQGYAVGGAVYALEIWEDGGRADTITNIAAQVELLLDRRREVAPKLPLSSGECLWMEAQSELSLLYDSERSAWCGLILYRAMEMRY